MILPSSVLGSFAILQNVDGQTLSRIQPMFSTKYYSKGQFVISARSQSTDVYFIVSGKVRVCFFSENGKLVHFDDLQAGMMFGELAAIDNMERSSDCIAVEDTQLSLLSSQDFRTLMSQHIIIQDAVLTRLAEMVRVNMRKVYEFTAYSVSQRIRFEILRLAAESNETCGKSIVLKEVPTHAEIAARVSTHREAVTRELKKLENKGVVTWRQSEYLVHDVVSLSETGLQ